MEFCQSRFVPTREVAEDLGIGTATVHRARKSVVSDDTPNDSDDADSTVTGRFFASC